MAKAARKSAKKEHVTPDEESHIDGCNVEFSEHDATPDAELPETRGGVETPRRRRGK